MLKWAVALSSTMVVGLFTYFLGLKSDLTNEQSIIVATLSALAVFFPLVVAGIDLALQFANRKNNFTVKSVLIIPKSNEMKNTEQITEISIRETKIYNRMLNLDASFFPVSILVIILVIRQLMLPAPNEQLIMSHDAMIVSRVFIIISLYAAIIIIGYFCHLLLSKKLDSLWVQKKTLF